MKIMPTAEATFDRDPSRVNRTEAALLSRGLDSETSERLRKGEWTLAKLKQCDDHKLRGLGVPDFVIQKIRAGGRSDIPIANLVHVLVSNRFTCCICRDVTKSIIVHHIHEWADSYDHSAGNLAVLCLEHHDRAHSKSSLSRNLDPDMLKAFKKSWETKVRELDTEVILDASRQNFDAWWYFNHLRLFELAHLLKVDLKKILGYSVALKGRLIDRQGVLQPRGDRSLFMYAGGEGMVLYDYVRQVMLKVLSGLTVLNISDYLDRGVLVPVLKPGDFVFVQGAHVFASFCDRHRGRNQRYQGTRRANHVEITFTFDRWEATSQSAWGWLSRRRDAASVLRVVHVETLDSKLHLECTVIGISAAAAGLKQREYASFPYRPGVVRVDDPEEEAEDFLADPEEDDPAEPF
jgi:hypothetical protein